MIKIFYIVKNNFRNLPNLEKEESSRRAPSLTMLPAEERTSKLPSFGVPCSISLPASKTGALQRHHDRQWLQVAKRSHHSQAARVVHMMASDRKSRKTVTIENRIARMRYDFLETYECGIELLGTEIKSVRGGKMNIRQGYGRVKDGEIFLHNVHISPWELSSKYFNHDPIRPRRLLLHKRSIRKLGVQQSNPGLTIVPTRAYFNDRGFLKVEIALARGKKLHDKREEMKRREDQRNMERVVKSVLGG